MKHCNFSCAARWLWAASLGVGLFSFEPIAHAGDSRTLSSAEISPSQLKKREGLKPFEYAEAPAPLPNYTPNAAWGTQSEPIRTMQKPLEPSESMKHLSTFPEFEVKLFAAEPDIAKAIWMAWDERGRLWIAETFDYPNNMQPPGQGHDQIKICEDTDGDGKADKFTVFADKLSIPTGFTFANGGLVVVHSGRTEFLKDTDGDDKADVRQTLFSGWGTGDTHAGPSNLRYGFDNWVWGTVGYSGFRGPVGGKEIRFGQGIYRFKPDGSKLEFVRSSNNNTWGLGITEDNIIFGSTANGNASMYMPIPNRYYEAVSGWSSTVLGSIADSQRFYPLTDKVRQVDYFGRYTAGAGSGIYTARNFPREYWNRAQFVAEPTGHLLGQFFFEPRGADFLAHNARNFAASDDEWTAPICAEVGPDGALWMIDWYNYVIQHNPTPKGFRTGQGAAYETPLRDQTHGRIYRLVYNKAKPTRGTGAGSLSASDPQQLLAALKNDNMLWRMTAQRLLVTRGDKDVVPALCALASDQSEDEIGLNPAAIHALWTLSGLNVLDGSDAKASQTARAALKHSSPSVRRAALMVLPRDESSLTAVLSSKMLDDPDAQVRMAALLAASEMPVSTSAGSAIFAMLQEPRNSQDRWIPDAATAAAARNDAGFLRAVLSTYKPEAAGASTEMLTNLLPNASFEEQRDGQPTAWRAATHSGRGQLAIADISHSGGHSAKISSDAGDDVSWAAQVPVKPRTDYRLTGWIKTENVLKLGAAHGAMLNVHEMQDPVRGGTRALAGDNDWTQVELNFNSAEMTQVTINCLLGGWGRVKGIAWFDDLELIPAPGSELAGEVGHVVRLVTTHYAQRGPVESIVPTLAALKGAPVALAVPILDGLVLGWPEGISPHLAEPEKKMLAGLMQAMPESIRDRLLALAQRWGQAELFGAQITDITDYLKKQITSSDAADEPRVAAAKRLIGLDATTEVIEFVLKQVTLLTTPSLAGGFINALTESRNPDTGGALIESWAQLTPSVRRAAIATLMRRSEWTTALLDAVEKGKITRTDLATEQWSQLKQNPNRMIARRAERLSNTGPAISADREEIVKKLLPLAKDKGDPARGQQVFTATCAVCHLFNGQGGKVGPDLTGIAARDRSEILVDILDPNRSVEANYRLWNVTTKGGDTFSGRLETETQTSVEILDTTGQKHSIQRKDLASMESSQLSIMPNGFEALPAGDLSALLEYLTQPHQ